VLMGMCLALPAVASADRAFSQRFSTNTQGNIAIAANSIESCLDASGGCADVRNAVGGAVAANNNNARTLTWIDADADPSTFDSSSSDLTLPAGATVLFAGLYYGGKLGASSGGSPAPNPSANNTVLFKAPGDTSYRALTTATAPDTSSTEYQGFVNVTGIVQAAGAGTYWTGNVQLGTGLSDATEGGWALVVAYGDPNAPSRNLSIFDGLQNISSSGNVTIPLSGFQTPLSGPVTSTVGLVAYEGDLGTTGDGASIQGGSGSFTALSNAVNPASNVFNSTISNNGTFVTSRQPGYQNNLGYDADLFSTTNVLGNNQRSTQVRLSTNGDAYQPGVVTIATDLFAPKINATKTVDRATANLGDTLTYTVAVQNTGQDAANGATFTDPIPAGSSYVPGSLQVGGNPVTDATGDDVGDFTGGQVVARIGSGASAAAGGTLATNASTTVSFQVRVDSGGLARGATIDNTASLAFTAATTGVASTVNTAPATTRVLVPDLTIGKSHSPALAPGSPSTYTITVGNTGDGPTSGAVTVTDALETGLTLNGAVTGTGWACTTSGATITCTRSDALAAGSNYPAISIPVLVSPAAQTGQLSNTASVQAPSDGNPDNNSVTDAGAVSQPTVDLHVDKLVTSTPQVTPAGYGPTETVTYRISVTNNGIANANNVQLAEAPDPRMTVNSITPSQGSCSGMDCNLATITPGQAPVTIDVSVTLPGFDTYPSDALMDNTASVSTPGATEINPDDNSATASISTLPWAETGITKTFSPAQPVAGGPVTYTLTVHNFGPGTVDENVLDLVPAALQNFTTSVSGGTGVCQFDPTGAAFGAPPPGEPIIGCDIPQFGPGEDRVITVQGTLAPDSANTVVDNLAGALSVFPGTDLGAEPDFSNNTAEVSFTPGTVDVGITKSVIGPSTVSVGDTAHFQLVASNSGTVAAENVIVTDTLPAGLEPVDLPVGCLAIGQVVKCALGELGPGDSQTIDLQAQVGDAAAGATVTNSASIASDEADLDSGNDTGSAKLTVNPLPAPPPPPGQQPPPKTQPKPVDVAVTVRPPSGLATVGVTGAWTVRVVNNGPATATKVTLTTTPHGKADVVDATISSDACFTSPAIRCGVGTLAPGASRTVSVNLRPTVAGQLKLAGRVSAAEEDRAPANNTDQAAVAVGLADVAISATATRPELISGTATTVAVTAVTRSRRQPRNATLCVQVPHNLNIRRPRNAKLRGASVCWPISRLARGHRRVFRLHAVAPRVTRPRTIVLGITVRGPGVRPRHAQLVLRIDPPPKPPPAPPPVVTG
jgi:uncharacterized repeat protein (TIGR01451 family)